MISSLLIGQPEDFVRIKLGLQKASSVKELKASIIDQNVNMFVVGHVRKHGLD